MTLQLPCRLLKLDGSVQHRGCCNLLDPVLTDRCGLRAIPAADARPARESKYCGSRPSCPRSETTWAFAKLDGRFVFDAEMVCTHERHVAGGRDQVNVCVVTRVGMSALPRHAPHGNGAFDNLSQQQVMCQLLYKVLCKFSVWWNLSEKTGVSTTCILQHASQHQ